MPSLQTVSGASCESGTEHDVKMPSPRGAERRGRREAPGEEKRLAPLRAPGIKILKAQRKQKNAARDGPSPKPLRWERRFVC
jgi:hypothetical protein